MTSEQTRTVDRDVERPELSRSLKQRHLSMIALGGIIGASLFIGSGSVIHTVGPGAVLSYALGGLLVVLVMRMLGEMATARPTLGSFMEYAREGLGPLAAFMVGWLYWYFWVGVVAFEAVAGGSILGGWIPGVPQWVFSLLLMLLLTANNLISTRSFGEAEFWLASIKVATIVVFLVVAVLFVLHAWPNASPATSTVLDHGGLVPNGWFAVVHGVVIVIFSYFGTEIVTMAAAESAEPAKAIARATATVVWRVLLFYVGSILLLVLITPWNQIPTDSSPYAAAFDRFGIPAAEHIVEAVVLTAALSVLNSGLYTASRMLFALQKHGWAPRGINDLSSRQVPWRAILLSTVVGYLTVIMNYISPDKVFSFIMNSAGAVALFVYAIIAGSQIVLRRRTERDDPEALTLKMWGFPFLSWATLVAVGLVVVSMGIVSDTRSQLFLSLVSVGIFAGCYFIVQSRKKTSAPVG